MKPTLTEVLSSHRILVVNMTKTGVILQSWRANPHCHRTQPELVIGRCGSKIAGIVKDPQFTPVVGRPGRVDITASNPAPEFDHLLNQDLPPRCLVRSPVHYVGC